MSNPWLKENPFMSMWLTGANSVANRARARMTAEAKRQTSAALTKATNEMFTAWTGSFSRATANRKKKNRFPGV